VPAAALEIDGVSKRYGELVALNDLSLRVGTGELFGFVGNNGAGKTTTMRIVLGVLAPDTGQVRLEGEPVGLAGRRRMGYLPEERGLYPKMKVLDHLVYLGELHGLSTNEAHSSAEFWITRFGLRERRTDPIQALSLGNAQRVQLAAALVHRPSLLVLDEPFAGLDPVAVDVLSQVLREQADLGVSVIFSSHQLDLVERLCDRIGIIADGMLRACGTVAELRAGAGTQLVVEAPHAPAGWAANIAGTRVLDIHNGQTTLLLDEGVDDQTVLSAALATGPVREFHRRSPSLADLFRDVVTGGVR
jgi:ABC-2 type transport system ATP-binding protein